MHNSRYVGTGGRHAPCMVFSASPWHMHSTAIMVQTFVEIMALFRVRAIVWQNACNIYYASMQSPQGSHENWNIDWCPHNSYWYEKVPSTHCAKSHTCRSNNRGIYLNVMWQMYHEVRRSWQAECSYAISYHDLTCACDMALHILHIWRLNWNELLLLHTWGLPIAAYMNVNACIQCTHMGLTVHSITT